MSTEKNITLEPKLFSRVEEEARKEGKRVDDLVNEEMRRFLALRQLRALQQYGARRATELGLADRDIERLIAESRAERPR